MRAGRHGTLLVLMGAGALLVGCSQYSRYNPNGGFGKEIERSSDTWNENLATKTTAAANGERAQVLAKGRDLFNDSKLGRNGQSCNSCHPGGGTTGGEVTVARKMGLGPYTMPIPSLVGAAATFPKYKVPSGAVISVQHMANNCIRMFMDGKRLPEDSPESIALVSYLHSLSSEEKIQVGATSQ